MTWLLGALAGLVALWLVLLLALWRAAPEAGRLREAARLLPDVLRLLGRLARDSTLPRGVRVRLWLLLGYLAFPLDLVPDVIPVIGYADDVVAILWVLRTVARRAGPDALERHWPGTPEGLAVVRRLLGPDGSESADGRGRRGRRQQDDDEGQPAPQAERPGEQ